MLKAPGSVKMLTMLKPYLQFSGKFSSRIAVLSDFQSDYTWTDYTAVTSNAAIYGEAIYGSAVWSSSEQFSLDWVEPTSYPATALAIRLRLESSKAEEVSFTAIGFTYTIGGIL